MKGWEDPTDEKRFHSTASQFSGRAVRRLGQKQGGWRKEKSFAKVGSASISFCMIGEDGTSANHL